MASVDNRRRVLLAQEAARIMVEEGVKDFGAAKRKASRHLGGSGTTRDLPSNREIEDEVAMRMRMYRATPDARAHLRRLREAALEAMQFLTDYRPRLVGSVLAGTATEHSDVNLHLFADTPEEVEVFLHDAGIPFQRLTQRHQIGREAADYPGVALVVDGVRLAMTIFPPEGLREGPRSPVTGKPVERAKAAEVAALLAEDDAEPLAPEARE
jgi:hypothetical protein